MNEAFRKFAEKVSIKAGSPWAFILSGVLIAGWLAAGPRFQFSDIWQLVISTISSVFTFLMVFLIQNTQNREMKALHLKVDEMIRATGRARNSLLDLEELSDDELKRLEQQFKELRKLHPETEKQVKAEIDEIEAAKNINEDEA